jgi:hypothetical protein
MSDPPTRDQPRELKPLVARPRPPCVCTRLLESKTGKSRHVVDVNEKGKTMKWRRSENKGAQKVEAIFRTLKCCEQRETRGHHRHDENRGGRVDVHKGRAQRDEVTEQKDDRNAKAVACGGVREDKGKRRAYTIIRMEQTRKIRV